MLPKDLPTSVEGAKGHIRYTIAVCIDRAMHSDQIFEEYFTVIKPLNISQEKTLLVKKNQHFTYTNELIENLFFTVSLYKRKG